MKIAIIGKGTSSIITCLSLLQNNYEIDVYFDSSKPQLGVAESTTPSFSHLILSKLGGLQLSQLYDKKCISFKYGANFINWGKKDQFVHRFTENQIALHFYTKEFNPIICDILERCNVKFIDHTIDKLEEKKDCVLLDHKKYDFVIHCCGWNGLKNVNYLPFDFNTVNSAFLYVDKTDKNYPEIYTTHEATIHGWKSIVPFPTKDLMQFGYFFNSDVDNIDEIKKIVPKDSRFIKWNSKMSKSFYLSKRQFLNGNALFFAEPLQALSSHYQISIAEMISDCILNNDTKNLMKNNDYYLKLMFTYQLSLAFHYSFGSKFDTKYWIDIKEKSINYFQSNLPNYFENIENLLLDDLSNFRGVNPEDYRSSIGTFMPYDVYTLYKNLSGKNINYILNFLEN